MQVAAAWSESCSRAVCRNQIDQCERHVGIMFSQRARRPDRGLCFGSCVGGDRSEMTKRRQPSLAQYSLRIFRARAKQPADPPFVRRQWTEGIREVDLLRKAVAIRDQLVLIVPGRFAAKKYRIRL